MVPLQVQHRGSVDDLAACGPTRARPPAFPCLGELSLPCTLLLGERVLPRTVRCNEAMAEAIPGCRLVRLPDCDHLPTLRAPETVRELVLEVWERVR